MSDDLEFQRSFLFGIPEKVLGNLLILVRRRKT